MRIDNPIGINAALTGSFSGSFIGDGSGLTSVAASNVEFANVLNKPTLLSGSAQIASQISGSFTAVSASIATRFDNLGSGFATDSELATVSSSFAGDITNIYNTYATDIELGLVSSSFATSITGINNTINGLDTTYATDAQLTAVSSSLVQADSNINATITAVSSSLVQTIQGVDSRLTAVSGSLATRIDNVNTAINNLGSTYATDAELISVSSSFAATTSTNVQIARLNSGSFAGRIDSINTTINNLGSTYATDSELASVSSSFATRVTTSEGTLSSAVSLNTTQNNRLAALEAATGSYQSGLVFNDTTGQGGIDFTNTSGTITATTVGLGTTSDVTFNNGTFNGNVFIDGNLFVSGSNTSLSVQNLQVADAFLYLNSGSNSTNPDMGFAGNYNDGTYHHAGFFRDASDAGTWKVFENYGPEPDADIYINTAHATFKLAPFAAAKINAASITGSLQGNASTASKLETARTITLGGDLTGNVSFDGSAGVTLTATIAADSVALGTDTTGNYVASLVAGTGITLANNTGEGATPTITNSAPDQTVVLTAGSNVSISGTYPNFTIASTDTNTTYTASTGLSLTGTAFSIDSSVVTLSGAQTLTNKTINGSQLVDASVANAKLTNSSVTVTAGTGMSGGGAVSLGSSITLTNAGVTSNVAGSGITVSGATGAVTITNSDKGSSQNIFKNIAVSGQTTVVADGNDDTLTLAAGSNVTITTNATTDTITIAATDTNTTYTAGAGLTLTGTEFTHTDTSSQATVTNSGRSYIQSITLDTYGHVTALTSATETVVNTDTTYSAGTGVTLTGTTFSIGQSVATSATPSFDKVLATSNGLGENFKVGDDAWIGDVNTANCIRIKGQQDATAGYISFGNNTTALGSTNSSTLTWGAAFTATGDITAYSDARVKENIKTIENGLDKVLALRGVTYNRTDLEDKTEKIGVIAQEIQEVLPQVVMEENDRLSVSYGNLAGVFIEAIKEQQTQIELLKAEIAELKNK
jgi:hypothetical protein